MLGNCVAESLLFSLQTLGKLSRSLLRNSFFRVECDVSDASGFPTLVQCCFPLGGGISSISGFEFLTQTSGFLLTSFELDPSGFLGLP